MRREWTYLPFTKADYEARGVWTELSRTGHVGLGLLMSSFTAFKALAPMSPPSGSLPSHVSVALRGAVWLWLCLAYQNRSASGRAGFEASFTTSQTLSPEKG